MARVKKKGAVAFRPEEYSYRVQWDGESHVGSVDEFPGLTAFADSPEGALCEIQKVVAEGLSLLAAQGQAIPEPLSRREYSGRMILRMDPALHRRLAQEAEREGISLNQLINRKLGTGA
jgi:predicted HicB family RNase H-like nuclease